MEKEYKLLVSGGDHGGTDQLSEMVTEHMKDGWEPSGAVTISPGRYAFERFYGQAMIREVTHSKK